MSTNIETWTGTIAEIGPLYPFAGSEILMWLLGIAFWIVWAFWQNGEESRQYQADLERAKKNPPPSG